MAANESAPTTAQSKRERKRQFINERLAFLDEKFRQDRDFTYRDQLQKIQVDTTLIQRLDPYDPNVLDTIADLRREHAEAQVADSLPESVRSLIQMAGPDFQVFLQDIEDVVENRDANVTQQKHEHDRRLAQYRNEHEYKVETARREHKSLVNTLRDRLINTVSSRKYRLMKEREALEISDSSALLLHPNQFSITNPASPGGPHGKRATRLRKDADDMPGFSDKKRKRAAGEDDGSPAPARRALDPNNTTPLWQNEKLRYANKQNGPAYNIEKLFTEKELLMTRHHASLAAHKYILKNKVYANGNASPNGSDSGNGDDADPDCESLAAPMMERTTSHSTRSTRAGINQGLLDAADAAGNLELPKHIDILHPPEPTRIPSLQNLSYYKSGGRNAENYPQPLSQDEANTDMLLMEMYKKYDAKQGPGASLDHPNGSRKLLESVVIPYTKTRYTLPPNARPDPRTLNDRLNTKKTED
ncbi:Sds3-like-domain-containing protein [Plectosphaerella plurivora]|uniref:Sds3-like-domain-containing protein n=1 Tax=Plectosphaerella plurivora TaxID=936078 RepID=A0A9P8V2V2_9PEZI|nr:Sds3-like-domain-containing protein [Plectosphaerella plurivora]